jgi:hypothetical protein
MTKNISVFGFILIFKCTFLYSMNMEHLKENELKNERTAPIFDELESTIMQGSNDINSKHLRLYFVLLSKEKKISELEIAEILGVNQSTINRFKNCGDHLDYVCQQFLKYKNNKGISISQLKENIDKQYSHISSAEQVEDILMMAKTEFLLPSIIKKKESLILYFEALLGNNDKNLEICDSILSLEGKLIEFVKNKNQDSNLTKLIYIRLLDYYRGVRWVFEKSGRRFIPLSEQLGWEYIRSADQSVSSFSDYFGEIFGFNKKKNISLKKN